MKKLGLMSLTVASLVGLFFASPVMAAKFNGVEITSAYVVDDISCTPAADKGSMKVTLKYHELASGTVKQPIVKEYSGDGSYTTAKCTAEIETIKKNFGNESITVGSSVPSGESGGSGGSGGGESGDECYSILTFLPCGKDDTTGEGVEVLLQLILDIMTAGVGVLATIGIMISGIQWMTARDNESQIVKAKSRIFNIVIGLVVWAIMWLALKWLLPGGIN